MNELKLYHCIIQDALLEIENQTRFLNKSHVFFITDTDEGKDQAVKFTKKTKCCYLTHVFQVASDKTPLYDAMYEILQSQLDNFLSDLHSRASTGLVRDLTPKLEPFLEKLRSRKKRHQSSLTKQCVSKIKSYVLMLFRFFIKLCKLDRFQ